MLSTPRGLLRLLDCHLGLGPLRGRKSVNALPEQGLVPWVGFGEV